MEYKILEHSHGYRLSMEMNHFASEGWKALTVFAQGGTMYAIMERTEQ